MAEEEENEKIKKLLARQEALKEQQKKLDKRIQKARANERARERKLRNHALVFMAATIIERHYGSWKNVPVRELNEWFNGKANYLPRPKTRTIEDADADLKAYEAELKNGGQLKPPALVKGWWNADEKWLEFACPECGKKWCMSDDKNWQVKSSPRPQKCAECHACYDLDSSGAAKAFARAKKKAEKAKKEAGQNEG